ncbi:unnamed protein product [Prorocentrum cordatum]|uniref:Uncharacterized protein n=1 Tax=Prorocentrum cordatum TaxID=2364126 RepID=A0ABN9VQK4_9DINO|nr:unnamed protein product [Polarella glacialis]
MASHSEPAEKAAAAPEALQEQNGGENTTQPKEDAVVQEAADIGSGVTDALLEHSDTVQHQLYAQRGRVAMALARISASKSFSCHEEMERAHATVLLKMQIEELAAATDKAFPVLDYAMYQCDELGDFYSKWTHSGHGWGCDEVAKDGAPTMGGGAAAETVISIQPQRPPRRFPGPAVKGGTTHGVKIVKPPLQEQPPLQDMAQQPPPTQRPSSSDVRTYDQEAARAAGWGVGIGGPSTSTQNTEGVEA